MSRRRRRLGNVFALLSCCIIITLWMMMTEVNDSKNIGKCYREHSHTERPRVY